MLKNNFARIVLITILFSAVPAAKSQIFVDFRTGNQTNVAALTLTFDIFSDSLTSGFNVTDPTLTGTFGTSSTGTFSITLTALGEGAGSSIDAANWMFAAAAGSALDQSGGANNGFGIVSTDNTGANFNNPEGVLIDIDTSGLTLAPGEFLQLDSINVRDANNNLQLWKQTGATSGVNTFSDGGGTELETWVIGGAFNQISDGDSFVLFDSGSGQKRFQGMTFSVVPEPSTALLLLTASVGLLFQRRVRSK